MGHKICLPVWKMTYPSYKFFTIQPSWFGKPEKQHSLKNEKPGKPASLLFSAQSGILKKRMSNLIWSFCIFILRFEDLECRYLHFYGIKKKTSLELAEFMLPPGTPENLLFFKGQSQGCRAKYDEDVIVAACQRSSWTALGKCYFHLSVVMAVMVS